MTAEPTTETRSLNGEEYQVVLNDAAPPEKSNGRFPPLEPGTNVTNGIRVDRDVAVKMRDGVTIYTDIYRPDGATDVPAIVAWSPYGKRVGYAGPASVPGVPEGTLSPGTKFEGPDPDFWCRQGYAVINPDARGAGYSEGVLQVWTKQEGEDIADLIEWVAAGDWCSGRVGMAGNSWLAASQWHAAAQRPPHLACIAPWEGVTDPYRDMFRIGGTPEVGFLALIDGDFTGGRKEDLTTNVKEHEFFDAYWKNKVPDLENIEIPVYICGGWQHHFHLRGAVRGFRQIKSQQKWLRLHREFEWPDFYAPENLEDLKRFFDRFLKGHHNGWELTPRVRIDVMDRGDRDHVTRRPETTFPLPDTQYRKLYLDAADGSLGYRPPETTASAAYDAPAGRATFDLTFDRDTELTGFLKLRLWVEARGSDDMDLFVAIQKADPDGSMVPTLVIGLPHPGANGLLRVSHRELDEALSTEAEPVQANTRDQRLTPGQIVPVDIPIWPTSRFFHAGERLRVVVSGHYVREPGWFERFAWDTRNEGEHVIHTGGTYDSHLLVPEIPQVRPVMPGESITAAKIKMT
jgi:uncharacterized protein